MGGRLTAFGIHALTALGALFGFLALIEASAHHWEVAFYWLGIALIVDGIDGPLARHFDVAAKLPRFSGEQLDLIIDYFTYVIVPAYIIYEAGFLPPGINIAAAALILLSSLYHFIDKNSKTEDGFFVGFPAIWNIIALYLFIFPMPPALALILVASLAALTFFPLKWVHPVRVRELRLLTLSIAIIWITAIIIALSHGLQTTYAIRLIIAACTIYFIAIGMNRTSKSQDKVTGAD